MLCLSQVCPIIHRRLSLVHWQCCRMKQILKTWIRIVPSVFLYILLHSLGKFELRIVWLLPCTECQFQTLRGLPIVSGFSTGRSTVTCQALREFQQLIGNQVHLLTWGYTMFGDQICECMICLDMHDADRCRACMRASVLTVCTPFGIHNVTLRSSCGTTASPTSSSDPLKTHGCRLYAYLIALRRLPLLATSPSYCFILCLHRILAWFCSYVLALWTVR